MLDMTLATSFEMGSNRKRKLGGNWSYILPTLELKSSLCFGVPPMNVLETMARLSDHVFVVDAQRKALTTVELTCQQEGWTNVDVILMDSLSSAWPVLEKSLDLVLISEHYDVRKLGSQRPFMAELKRTLHPDGIVYFEYNGWRDLGSADKPIRTFAQQLGTMHRFWVTPFRGEMETAVPASDKQIINYFIDRNLYSPVVTLSERIPFVKRTVAKSEHLVWQNRPLHKLVQRFGVVIQNANAPKAQLPQYLLDVLSEAGIDGTAYRWGVLAGGLYPSRKIVFFLFEQQANVPTIVVKMTRQGNINYRIENEHRGLILLKELGIGEPATMPQPVFLGYHAGLALMGQSVVEGTPFQDHTSYTASCPYTQDAIAWLTELGRRTVDTQAATAQEVADGLNYLYDQFVNNYRPTPKQDEFLRRQLDVLRTADDLFPLVFQHGDPGTWNILVTPNGQPAFLDWEAAEPQGMPLWDLFYFLRSYAVGAARTENVSSTLDGFKQFFVQDSPLSNFIVETVQQYCEAIGLPHKYVEPLFFLCWVHRSLKQATRFASPERAKKAHYYSIIDLCIEHRQAATLKRLFD